MRHRLRQCEPEIVVGSEPAAKENQRDFSGVHTRGRRTSQYRIDGFAALEMMGLQLIHPLRQ